MKIGYSILRNLTSLTLGLLLSQASLQAQDNSTSTPAPSAAPATNTAPPPSTPAAPATPKIVLPPSPPLPAELILPPPGGPVVEYLGHRKLDDKGSGWGWIKLPNEDWKKARWVSLRETPGKVSAPWRALGSKEADENFEYKMYGYFANHQVYDPIYDEMLDVFVLDHYESLGLAQPLTRQPGPAERFTTRGHASHASSRATNPIRGQEDF